MLRLLVLFILLSVAFPASSQVQSSPFAQPAFFAAYDKDAKHMAVTWAYDNHTPDTAFIDIPASAVTPIANGLAAIFNTGGALKADTIFANYCLHNDDQFFNENTEVTFLVDTVFAWTHAWLNHQPVTGVALMDQTLAYYGFDTVVSAFIYQGQGGITLRSHQFLNCRRLGDSLSVVPGVIAGGSGGWGIAGSANQIFCYNANNGVLHFKFIAAGGFVPAQMWDYNVLPGFWVDSLSIYGGTKNHADPLPNCGLHPTAINILTATEEITLAPNPATDYLLLRGGAQIQQYRVLDLQGRIVSQGTLNLQSNRIETRLLAPGNYCLQMIGINGKTLSRLFTRQ